MRLTSSASEVVSVLLCTGYLNLLWSFHELLFYRRPVNLLELRYFEVVRCRFSHAAQLVQVVFKLCQLAEITSSQEELVLSEGIGFFHICYNVLR